jgi:hypothetical protein
LFQYISEKSRVALGVELAGNPLVEKLTGEKLNEAYTLDGAMPSVAAISPTFSPLLMLSKALIRRTIFVSPAL